MKKAALISAESMLLTVGQDKHDLLIALDAAEVVGGYSGDEVVVRHHQADE